MMKRLYLVLSICMLGSALAWLTGCSGNPAPPAVPAVATAEFTQPPPASPVETTQPLTPTLPAGQTSAAVAPSAAPPEATATPARQLPRLPGIEEGGVPSLQAVGQIKDAGAAWMRINALDWSKVEAQEGTRNWQAVAGLEAAMAEAAKQRLAVILVVRGTPTWAQKVAGSACGPIKPDKLPAYAAFMQDLVKRYSAPPYNLRYYELGNEPDVDPGLVGGDSPFGCQGNSGDALYGGGDYAEQLKQVYPAIKAANPAAQVLVGGLMLDCDPVNPPANKNCQSSRFLEGILANGGGDFFDGVSFHGYDYYAGPYQYKNSNWHSSWDTNGPVIVPKTIFLRSLLKAFGYPEKYLLNTEAGLLCGRDGSEAPCQAKEYELSKAYYLAELNFLSRLEGLDASIWYSLTGWRGTGMLNADGSPQPIYDAFRFNAQQLDGAQPVGKVTGLQGVRGVEVKQKDGKRIWLIWSADGQPQSVTLPGLPAAIYDVFGAAQTPVTALTLDSAPYYIEWAP